MLPNHQQKQVWALVRALYFDDGDKSPREAVSGWLQEVTKALTCPVDHPLGNSDSDRALALVHLLSSSN